MHLGLYNITSGYYFLLATDQPTQSSVEMSGSCVVFVFQEDPKDLSLFFALKNKDSFWG